MNNEESNELMPLGDEMISSLVLNGDLRGLNPQQKVEYYRAFCQRLGLDPATQPLKLLKLQGREILYCDRSGAQQLNRKHNIGHQIVAREVVNDCYVVTARATQSGGRFEESIGAVPILGLKGEALCNAMMKAETKSKRRSTLDLCGLGMLDETEIGEWAAGGQTSTIEGKEQKTVPMPKMFQKAKETMKSAEEPRSIQGGEEWKNTVCTWGKTNGPVRNKRLGDLKPNQVSFLYEKFCNPESEHYIHHQDAKDKPLQEGLIAWHTWVQEQKQKREAFEKQKQVEQSWEEPDEIPMDYPESEVRPEDWDR